MKSPIEDRKIESFDEVTSTQDIAAKRVVAGEMIGAVLANHQIAGRGRLQRNWISNPGDSLISSTIFWDYPDHPRPYLLGMSMAIAVAGAVHTRLQWPNDITIQGKKLGGILVEMVKDSKGRKIAVIGLGLNLNQIEFPEEIASRATSLILAHGKRFEPQPIYLEVMRRLTLLPEPESWETIHATWDLFDETPGKKYKLFDGDEAIAIGIGSEGQLIASKHGESIAIYAADAMFGSSPS